MSDVRSIFRSVFKARHVVSFYITQGSVSAIERRGSMRRFIFTGCVVWIVCAFGLADSTLQAQPYPNRPIQVIIPMGPGTGTDIHGRILVEELKKNLRTEIVVVNKPGASQTIGTDAVVKSKKDGYTLLYAGGAATRLFPSGHRSTGGRTLENLQ
jgi:tripartite-type tricarboxylate transporter receptor subunit TctC